MKKNIIIVALAIALLFSTVAIGVKDHIINEYKDACSDYQKAIKIYESLYVKQ